MAVFCHPSSERVFSLEQIHVFSDFCSIRHCVWRVKLPSICTAHMLGPPTAPVCLWSPFFATRRTRGAGEGFSLIAPQWWWQFVTSCVSPKTFFPLALPLCSPTQIDCNVCAAGKDQIWRSLPVSWCFGSSEGVSKNVSGKNNRTKPNQNKKENNLCSERLLTL